MKNLLIPYPDPKQMARDFLRHRGVEYCDLITGDHAADLLVYWMHAFTEWDRVQAENRIRTERMQFAFETVTIADPKDKP
jgi:hypothetical protein